jgi:F-type H+-transporting ATPase subunit gamma
MRRRLRLSRLEPRPKVGRSQVPAGEERAIRRRIRSVVSTQKITRAMELIAASRIVRAQQAMVAARPYAERMEDVVRELAATPEAQRHWIFAGGGDRSLVVVLGADRGLCGAFNSSVHRVAEELLGELGRSGPAPDVIAVGRKAKAYFRFRGRAIAESLEGFTDRPGFEDAQRVVEAISHELETGTIGQIYLVSTHFLSVGSQRAERRRLVPLDLPERKDKPPEGGGHEPDGTNIFEFEPEPDAIIDRLLPRWLEAEVYLALLESAASFHVAQQRAMKAATDNADDLIKTLRRRMNRARQDSITTEIAEISGGAEALRQADSGDEDSGRPDIYVYPNAS